MQMTRGDTFEFRFQRQTTDKQVITTKPDKMFFTVKNNTFLTDFLFQKSLEAGTITYDEDTYYYNVTIEPQDTNELSYGDYYYDIEIIDNGKVKTIAKGTLTIEEEVTFAANEV